MSPQWRSVADVLSALAGFVFFSLLSAQAFLFARYMYVTTETGEDLNVQLWPFMVFVAACGIVFSARLVANPRAAPTNGGEASNPWI